MTIHFVIGSYETICEQKIKYIRSWDWNEVGQFGCDFAFALAISVKLWT